MRVSFTGASATHRSAQTRQALAHLTVLLIAIGVTNAAWPDAYSGSRPARRAYARGVKAQKARRLDVAVYAYQRAMNLDPKFASAYQKYFEAKQLAFSQEN